MCNIIEKEVEKAFQIISKGGIIVYPTETVWGIGCDSMNNTAIKNIYKIKNRESNNPMLCIVNNMTMVREYIKDIPEDIEKIIINTSKPTTIIYNNSKNISDLLLGDNRSIGLRITSNKFCQKLISKLGRPLVSTSANISGKKATSFFKEIDTKILKEVDYVVNLQSDNDSNMASSIIKINIDGTITKIR